MKGLAIQNGEGGQFLIVGIIAPGRLRSRPNLKDERRWNCNHKYEHN